MSEHGMIILMAFALVSSMTLLIFLLIGGRQNRLDRRLQVMTERGELLPPPDSIANLARSTLPKIGAPLLPKDSEKRTRLQTRLIHAGLYHREAMVVFLGVKMIFGVLPVCVGLVLGLMDLVPLQPGLLVGSMVSGLGLIGPSFWLDRMKVTRQNSLRRALPDALDVLVICLEGGGSLLSSMRRVASELRTAHPLLAFELNIVQREVQLGRPTGDALRYFADRADLEELRSLASVVLQTERYGASLVKALRVHAETLREKRLQYAEEMAQKAAIKILFPTVLFILPAMFIVILGPTTLELIANLSKLK